MALDVGELVGRLRLDDSHFERGMGSAERQFVGLGQRLVGIARTTAGLIGTALAGGVALAAGKELLDTSRRLVDLDRKFRAVFEDQLPAIQAWAEANRRAFGTSRTQVVAMAANLADLLKPMGFTAKQATDQAKRVLDLAGALSKWSGGTRTAAEVADILTTAMLGEREQLKTLGISITEAEVQARLLAKGQQDLTGAALQQAQAIATQELIFEKSKDAQKAWADGGRAAAEAQGTLSSSVETLKEKVAQLLTPAFERLTEVVAGFADQAIAKFDEVSPKVQGFVDKELGGLQTSLGDLAAHFIAGVKSGFDEMLKSIIANEEELRSLGKYIEELVGEAGPALESILKLTGAILGAIIEDVATAWRWLIKFFELIGALPENSEFAPGNSRSITEVVPKGPGGSPTQRLTGLADGGLVPATPGGRLAVLAEGGEDEFALPDSRLRALLAEAAAMGGGGRGGTLHVVFTGDGILRGLREEARIAGGDVETVYVGV